MSGSPGASQQEAEPAADVWTAVPAAASAGDGNASPDEPTPRRIHFIYLTEAPREYPLIYYVAVKSAKQCNPDYEIILHCNVLPEGPLWPLLEGSLTLRLVPMPEQIFGQPIKRIEHRADILRLEILMEFGGVYLDLDTICLRPFDRFLHRKAVMALEGGAGLCNAVIIAPRNSEFLFHWFAAYARFHNDQWSEFSVALPFNLAKAHPELIVVEPSNVFFEPSHGAAGLEQLFIKVGHFPNAHLFHLWNYVAAAHIANITVQDIFARDSTYNLAARKVLGADSALLALAGPVEVASTETGVLKETFTRIYEKSAWGRGSGNGSDPASTVEYRAFLEKFITMNRIRSIIDIGCGDWQFSRFVSFGGANYRGFDLVESLITRNTAQFGGPGVEFHLMPDDPSQLPSADLFIIKDVLQHLSDELIMFYRDRVLPRYRYCLVTNSFNAINYEHNKPIKPGMFRSLDLLAPPYHFNGGYVTESWNQWERIRTLLIVNQVSGER